MSTLNALKLKITLHGAITSAGQNIHRALSGAMSRGPLTSDR